MKLLRDGMEDYEYIWLLKQKIQAVKAGQQTASTDWLKRAEKAAAVKPSIVETIGQFTTDGSEIVNARREIANLLLEN